MDIQQSLQILKLERNASIDEAKRAHRNLAFVWHPDRYCDQPYVLQKRAEREMQKINGAYETVLSFITSQQEKHAQAHAQARAKAAAEARAKAEAEAKAKAKAEAKALRRKIIIRKTALAFSLVTICFVIIIGYTLHDQTRPTSRHLEHSPLNPDDVKAYANQGNGQGEVAKEATPVPDEPKSSKPEEAMDAPKEEPFAVAVAVEPESSKLQEAMDALEQERFSEAVALFEETLASDPSMMNKVSAPYARAFQGQASKLAKTDPYKAKTLLLKAVELDPGSLQAHFQLGLLYASLKNYPKAIDRYEKAAELDPQFSETFFNLGYVYAINKNYSRAKEMYGRVVELAPRFVDEALFNLAIVHDKLGDRDKCVRTLKKAIIANPANESAKKYLQRLKGK